MVIVNMVSRRGRRFSRIVFLVLIGALLVVLLTSYANSAMDSSVKSEAAKQASLPFEERKQIAPPRDNVTVYTGQGFVPPSGFGRNSWPDNALVALAPDGRLLYYEAEHDAYQDVDPSPEGKHTVLFAASDFVDSSQCNATVNCQKDSVVRLNLTTGERETLYTFTAPRRVNYKLHDVDWIDEHRLLVAGMAYDRIYIVNATTNIIEWQWSVQQAFNFSSGGSYPADWTHINDVEYIPHKGSNGWVMVSLRNQDQVIFVDLERGLVENWTLGADGDYDVLNEQHNPDYIPESEGGPAVLITDSQNRRIVEYQRSDGEWEETWVWADGQMSWPRDADRLPNGNTLISDTHGDRLLEVDESGDVVWSVRVGSIYEAERLGTGDESSGGESARKLGLQSKRLEEASDPSAIVRIRSELVSLLPEKVVNGIRFVLPGWMSFVDAVALAGILTVVITWAILELWWSSLSLRPRSPVEIKRRE
jgi:hypothetical protein